MPSAVALRATFRKVCRHKRHWQLLQQRNATLHVHKAACYAFSRLDVGIYLFVYLLRAAFIGVAKAFLQLAV